MKLKPGFAAISLAALTFVGFLGTAKADIQYLVRGTFDDGSKVFGYFDINVYGYVGPYDLTTTSGTLSGETYMSGDPVGPSGSPNSPPFTTIDFFSASHPGALQLTFKNPLGSPGPDPLVVGVGGPSWENVGYTLGGSPIRYVTAVPELSTWAMLWLGFAGLGWAAHRRARSRPTAPLSVA